MDDRLAGYENPPPFTVERPWRVAIGHGTLPLHLARTVGSFATEGAALDRASEVCATLVREWGMNVTAYDRLNPEHRTTIRPYDLEALLP